MESPAGGGWGHPLQRDPAAVQQDVASELLSVEEACEVYGVVIDPETGNVNREATAAKREQMGEDGSGAG
jgi:N-methylhydantoinase B